MQTVDPHFVERHLTRSHIRGLNCCVAVLAVVIEKAGGSCVLAGRNVSA